MKFFFLSGILFIAQFASAQFENTPVQLGGAGSEDIISIFPDSDGQSYWTGITFSGELPINGNSFQSEGDVDIFIGKWTDEGLFESGFSLGSTRQDELKQLELLPNGNLFLVAYFYKNLFLPDTTIEVSNSLKAIFIGELSPQGELLQSLVISGTGQKEVGYITLLEDGSALIPGSFSNEVFIGDSTFISQSLEDAFLVKMTPDYTISNGEVFTSTGRAIGRSAMELEDGSIVFAGHFTGSIVFQTNTLITLTPDYDLFFAKWDATGNEVQVKRMGGVYDSRLEQMVLNENRLVFAGNHRGVIRINDTTNLETQGLNDNIFVFSTDTDLNYQWGKSLGGSEDESLQQLSCLENQCLISGFSTGDFSIDGTSLPLNSGFSHGFLLSLDNQSGDLKWHSQIQGEEFVLSKTAKGLNTQHLYWGLSFSKNVNANFSTFTSNGFYDVLFGKLKSGISRHSTTDATNSILIYPNPTSGQVNLPNELLGSQCNIFSSNGKLIFTQKLISTQWMSPI
ncbi:MAG: hypothetical protein R2879_16160 [Saprospiraceae bacterium]